MGGGGGTGVTALLGHGPHSHCHTLWPALTPSVRHNAFSKMELMSFACSGILWIL